MVDNKGNFKNKDELLVKDNWHIWYEDNEKTKIRQLSAHFEFKVEKKEVVLSCLIFGISPQVGGLRWLLGGRSLNDLFKVSETSYPIVKSDDLIIKAYQEYDKVVAQAVEKAKTVIQLKKDARVYKIELQVLKEAIVKEVPKFLPHIKDQFEGITEDDLAKLYLVKKWASYGKEVKSSGHTVYCFDCTPFEAQLRAYIITLKGQIVDVQIQAE